METEPLVAAEVTRDAPSSIADSSQEERSSTWMSYAIHFLLVIAVVTSALAVYHFAVVQRTSQKLALIDISEVINIKQLEMTDLATRPDATNDDRESIYDSVTMFSKNMESAIAQIQQECGCVLLVRNAVVKTSGIEDLTPLLKTRLGLERSVAELAASIKRNPGPKASSRLDGSKAVVESDQLPEKE